MGPPPRSPTRTLAGTTASSQRLRTRRLHAAAGRSQAVGATPENARGVVSSLVGANLAGHDSHGVIRIPSYVADIKAGRLKPAATPELTSETAATASIDGAATFGQVGARLTAQTAARKARDGGLAAAALLHAGHTGRIGEWAELGAAQGMV